MLMSRFEQYRTYWQNYLLGERWNPESENAQTIIKSLERMTEDAAPKNDNSEIVTRPDFYFTFIYAMCYKTKGTKYYNSTEIKEKIITELDCLYKTCYNKSTSKENWWLVEIGNPLYLLNTIFLMYDDFDDLDGEIKKWTDVILHMQDAYVLTSRGQQEGGANLMWKCHVHFLCGILRKEQSLIDVANVWLDSIIDYSGTMDFPGMDKMYVDGFFPDGSFVQHFMFSYTGGYGKHLLMIISGLLFAFRNTDLITLTTDKKELFYKFIHESYEPLLYKGNFMDFSRGREVSRYFGQDNMIGRFIIRGLCYLSQTMPKDEKLRTIALIKEQLKSDVKLLEDEFTYAEYYVYPSLLEVLEDIENTDVFPRGELTKHYNFGIVSKVVHHTNSFAFAISMYSKNIAAYEYLNGESNKLWHVSDGMTYLYTCDDSNQYHHDYYATADMQRLAGTTVDRSPNRKSDPYYSWYLPEAKNVYAFAGGAELENIGVAGMQYRGQGNGKERDLEVKKSWFMFDNKIICLGSGITSTTNNPIETIVDNRRLNGNEIEITANGVLLQSNVKNLPIKSLHFKENKSNIAYYFPEETDISVLQEHREGTWNTIEINPENKKENDFAMFYISHGKCPKDAYYAYTILPNYTKEMLSKYVLSPDFNILENSVLAHAVEEKSDGVTCVNFWGTSTYTAAGITANTQCCVILKVGTKTIDIAVSDPCKLDSIIELTFDFNVGKETKPNEKIKVISFAPLKMSIDTRMTDGQTCNIQFSK